MLGVYFRALSVIIPSHHSFNRLKVKAEGSTHLTYTGLCGGLEHLKVETRLTDERFESVMSECEI